MQMKSAEEQLKILNQGAEEIIPEEDFVKKLETGKQLRVKWGADPSAPDIHLGHVVILNKLRQFQTLGHKVVFIVGDFTACIGDPSGKSETRKPLTKKEVKENARTYQEQIFKILDKKLTEVVYNRRWLSKLQMDEVMKLASHYTIARMLERDDFAKRYSSHKPISIHELFYPLIQGYDSVMVNADIEIGGTDQKFNMLVGRELQKVYDKKIQSVLTLPLLEGTDGVKKMSKSLGNYIGITEPPKEIFGKVMSISDKLMLRYYELLTLEPLDKIKKMHPKEAKQKLAGILVERFYDKKAATEAKKEFEAVFAKGSLPKDIEKKTINKKQIPIIDLLIETKLTLSKSEARRLIKQGGVKVDDKPVADEKEIVDLSKERIIKVGKRKFLKVKKK